jgi:hypothetical protein
MDDSDPDPARPSLGILGSLLQHPGLPSPLGSTTPYYTLPVTARPTQDYTTGSAHLTRPDTPQLLRTPSPLSPLFNVCLSSQPPRALPPVSPPLICSVSPVSPCLARLSHRAATGPPIMGRPVPARTARAFGIPHRTRLGSTRPVDAHGPTCLYTRPRLGSARPARTYGPVRSGPGPGSTRPDLLTHTA